MSDHLSSNDQLLEEAARYPLLDALRNRRSRRFGLGMKIPTGPFAYESQQESVPLTEEEEAALAFAACGITGYALADLSYGAAQGGSMLAGLVGRTVASADAMNIVAVVVTNDTDTYLLKRPQDFTADQVPELLRLSQDGALVELYRRSRVRIGDGRMAAPLEPGYNFVINRWSLYRPGSTYFIPINCLTGIYINAIIEAFDTGMEMYLVDERALLRPAGLSRFARSRGGHLQDDLAARRTGTILAVEHSIAESAAVEQGMVLQNLGLMTEALGLCGFPNFARHDFGWFEALGFRTESIPATRYLGQPRWLSWLVGLLGKDRPVHFPVGLEREGEVLLKPYCPPYYPDMKAAVRDLVESKFGSAGIYRGGARASGWKDPEAASGGIAPPGERAVEAAIAYCDYIYRRYGRFPAYSPPFRTCIGFQVTHGDVEFYDRYYRPEALTQSQREHLQRWHKES